MKKIIPPFLLVLLTLGCAALRQEETDQEFSRSLGLVPRPSLLRAPEPGAGPAVFRSGAKLAIAIESEDPVDRRTAQLLRLELASSTGLELAPGHRGETAATSRIVLRRVADRALAAEAYRLEVARDEIVIEARESAGLFYGTRTLLQLMPTVAEGLEQREIVIPCLAIEDEPRFPWRGMLLDCGRHFMDKDFVKRTIDLLAYHKMNRLHWHLTEDQGWRIEIEKYPRLTEIGAFRHYADGSTYGGFYSREDIKEVVAYAKERFVTVVPEIEMPGHSLAALAAYPEFSCTGGPFEVATQWGVHKDVYCAGKDATFRFLEDVLIEVMELFPSTYIHIGGDECPKDRWQACAYCQDRIRAEGLADEQELQSLFIKRIERFLASHGRRLIGWDEILEGGLPPAATVQSWRGMEGAIAAARSGHDAIVSPTSHAYFDYDIATTDLRRVFHFEPVPGELRADEARHILGGECNMWTERAPQETIDSKVFPRILAMAEVLWSPRVATEDKEARFRDSFRPRLRRHYARLDQLGVAYGPEAKPLNLHLRFDESRPALEVTMEAGEEGLVLRYTTDGSAPSSRSPVYETAIYLEESTILQAQAFRAGKPYGAPERRDFLRHRAQARTPKLETAYSPRYPAGGDLALVDGLLGSDDYRDGAWQGFEGSDFEATIDLGASTPLRRISTRFLQNVSVWIFLPNRVEIEVSADGRDFATLATFHNLTTNRSGTIEAREFAAELDGRNARYVRIRAEGVKVCPPWHTGAGGPCWTFIDEIVID